MAIQPLMKILNHHHDTRGLSFGRTDEMGDGSIDNFYGDGYGNGGSISRSDGYGDGDASRLYGVPGGEGSGNGFWGPHNGEGWGNGAHGTKGDGGREL